LNPPRRLPLDDIWPPPDRFAWRAEFMLGPAKDLNLLMLEISKLQNICKYVAEQKWRVISQIMA
jgi:hypothetical protein